jgi:dGTP triphosphohydrolase
MKKNQHIDILLEKYWEGETTLAEEKTLQQFFNYEDIHEDYQVFQPIFKATIDHQNLQLSTDFDAKLLAILENTENKKSNLKEATTKVIQLENTTSAEIQKWRWIAGVAASIALILAIYVIMPKSENTNPIADNQSLTEEEHQEALKAYEQTKTILLFVSAKMNHGTQTAAKGLNKVKDLDKVLETINEE